MGRTERSERKAVSDDAEVDVYGLPILAFGERVPLTFFEVLGRIVAVHGKIEYLRECLGHQPPSETSGVRKVEQFFERCRSGQKDRNAVVHSLGVFGVHKSDPDVILGLRYKIAKQTSGEIATVSILDVPDSEREQDTAQYTLDDFRQLLRRSIATMRIGEGAHTRGDAELSESSNQRSRRRLGLALMGDGASQGLWSRASWSNGPDGVITAMADRVKHATGVRGDVCPERRPGSS